MPMDVVLLKYFSSDIKLMKVSETLLKRTILQVVENRICRIMHVSTCEDGGARVVLLFQESVNWV